MILIDLFENTDQNSEQFDQFKHIFTVGFDPWRACNFLEQHHLTVNNCPQLKPFLEQYKVELIKAFLLAIQNGGDSAQIVKIMTQRLLGTEIGWYELTVLNRSANEIWAKHTAKMNESWSPSAQQDQARALLTDLDELLITDKTYFQRVDNILDALTNTVSGQVFNDAMNRRKQKLLAYLARPFDSVVIWWAIVTTFIEYVDNSWPELTEIIESHKHIIIKLILVQIRDLKFHRAQRTIFLLNYMHIDWPEFAIIKNSLNAKKNV